MTLRAAYFFDNYATADLDAMFTNQNGCSIVAGAGPQGQAVLRDPGSAQFASRTFDSQATWIVEETVSITGTPSNQSFLRFFDLGTEQFNLASNADGTVSARRGASTVIATSTFAIPTSTYGRLGCKVTIHNTAGVIEVRWNGVAIIGPLTSQNTRATANNSANMIRWQAAVGNFDRCDIVVMDGTTTATDTRNDFLGSKRVYPIVGGGTGNYNQWTRTGGSSLANALSSADGDTSRVDDSTAGHRFSLTSSGLPSGLTGIVGGGINLYLKKTDAGQRTVKPSFRIGGTDYDGAAIACSDTYRVEQHLLAQSPATASDFTQSEASGLEFGAKMES
jgi:hypothetical protein